MEDTCADRVKSKSIHENHVIDFYLLSRKPVVFTLSFSIISNKWSLDFLLSQ